MSDGETQQDIDANMNRYMEKPPYFFTNRTRKAKTDPIKIQGTQNEDAVVQPTRRIPLHYYKDCLQEIQKMLSEDVIEEPIPK